MVEYMTIVQAIVSGLLFGFVYALISIGLNLIFGVMRIINFAHGEFLMLGLYITFWLWDFTGLDPYLFTPVVFILLFVLGFGIQKSLIKRILGFPDVSQIFLTLGVSLMLANAALLFWTPNLRRTTVSYAAAAFNLVGITINLPRLAAALISLAATGVFAAFMLRTDTGKAMRATAQDREVASLMGIKSDRMFLLAWGLGAALAGIAGTVISPFFYAFPNVGGLFVIPAFVIVVMGGMGSITGALVASLIVGVVESLSAVLIATEVKDIFIFSIFILVLLLKPSGLLGKSRL